MKLLLPLIAIPAFLCLSATLPDRAHTTTFQTGTYGVCGCADETTVEAKLALTVKEDGTFHYTNSSDAANPIDRTGEWRMDGRKLVLTATGTDEQTWTLDKNDPCLRSRSGLLFVRLCRLKECR